MATDTSTPRPGVESEGEAGSTGRGLKLRVRVMRALKAVGRPVGTVELAVLAGVKFASVWSQLAALEMKGKVRRAGTARLPGTRGNGVTLWEVV